MPAPLSGGPSRPLAEINVTPFVDVMLVLLVIFMVTAPMMQQGVDVDLPETTSQPIRMRDEPLVLTVHRDGAIEVAGTPVPLEELEAKLRAVFDARGDEDLYLRADAAAPYGLVAKVLAAAREAGARRLGMVTRPESE